MKPCQTYEAFFVNFFKVRNLCYLLFIANFFLGSCSTSPTHSTKKLPSEKVSKLVTEEEREWMEKFFKDFFLRGSCIYTLFGSKPISGEMLYYINEEDHKEILLFQAEQRNLEGKEREEYIVEGLRKLREDDFLENWEKWISFIKRFPKSPFLFAKHPHPSYEGWSAKSWSAYILNVQETVWTLQKHHDIFKKQLGFDFDPVSVTMDFENEDSDFWKQVFSNHLLTGIVYGFGYKNSYFFNMYMKTSPPPGPLFSSTLEGTTKESFSGTLETLRLPAFRSFRLPFNDDPLAEKYRAERKRIKSELNDSNFFEMVLLQLTGDLSKEKAPPN